MARLIAALTALAALLAPCGLAGQSHAQAPIEGELNLITPVSKFIHDAALKAFAEYAKEKWNVTVKASALAAGTPVAYGRIVEWKGRPEVDIFWGGERALFDKLAEQKLLAKLEICRRRRGTPSRPRIGKPKPIPLKDPRTASGSAPCSSPTASCTTRSCSSGSGCRSRRTGTTCCNPKLKGKVAQCAPTRSSSVATRPTR